MVKADITTDNGSFIFERLTAGQYFAEASYIGLTTFTTNMINLDISTTLPDITLQEDAKQLEEVVVTAARALIEVKADRTVFNVQGTINSAGENGLNLLRKAPGVLVDNNNNISVLGRAGVLVYVDGNGNSLDDEQFSSYCHFLQQGKFCHTAQAMRVKF